MSLPSPDLFFDNKKNIVNEFRISLQNSYLPIDFSPCRINYCQVCICLAGHADIEIDLRLYHIVPNDIIMAFPGQIWAFNEKSNDFSLSFFSFSNELIDEVLYRFPSAFIGFLKENVRYHLPEEEKNMIMSEYFKVLNSKFCDTTNVCRREIILNLLHNFYLDLYNKVIRNNKGMQSLQRKHKKEVLEKFFHLVKTNIGNRQVAFYAGKLCITPKYLSIITKECAGTSAKELIDKFAITELKLQLKSTSTPLKEIAAQLDYPCEAFLCKFFKRHTGTTPSHYRNASR